MKIEITARNFKPSPHLKSFIEVRLRTLLKYDSHITSFKVVLLKEGRAEKVELIITSNKGNYITKCYTSVFEKTIINAIEKHNVRRPMCSASRLLIMGIDSRIGSSPTSALSPPKRAAIAPAELAFSQ